jgi:hypothetical protein
MLISARASSARSRRLAAAAFVVVLLAALMGACGGGAAPTVAIPTVPPIASALASALGGLASGLPGLPSGLPGLPSGLPGLPAGSGLGANGAFCKLFTADEIQAAAGDTIITTEGDDNSCTWVMSRYDTINVRMESGSPDDFAAIRLIMPDARDVPGLGDRSIWGPGLTLLYTVAKGKTWAVQMVLFPADDAKNLSIATGIMQKLLLRV